MRYRFYREHKYVSYMLSELERLVARTDFRVRAEIDKVQEQLSAVEAMLKGHAEYEDKSLHALLRRKGSTVQLDIEADHKHHEKQFRQLRESLKDIRTSNDAQKQLSLGYTFYLYYRLFVSENLQHLHAEETIIMPELQRLYTDDELRTVEFNTYSHMTPEQMMHMIEVLFRHMNPTDCEVFLKDIKDAEPEKFAKLGKKLCVIASVAKQSR